MRFADRREAGQRLAAVVAEASPKDPVVLALPRGGVPVARELADALGAPLTVLGVRKLGAPRNPELAVGAISEGGVAVVDAEALRILGIREDEIARIAAAENAELARRIASYRGQAGLPALAGRTALVTDDGLATGWTAAAAARAARAAGAARVWVCAPVGSPAAIERLAPECDAVLTVISPSGTSAVGESYDDFRQVTDAEVLSTLNAV